MSVPIPEIAEQVLYPSVAALRAALAASTNVDLAGGGAPLEVRPEFQDVARSITPEVLEGSTLEVRPCGEPVAVFTSFLDGIQRSEYAAYIGGVPIIVGTVAAAVRERRERRAHTWRVERERRLYAPLRSIGRELGGMDAVQIEDTSSTGPESQNGDDEHPFLLAQRAFHEIQAAREKLEGRLASEWLASRSEILLVDGGISRIPGGAKSASLVGLVKSHRTIYGGDAVKRILNLPARARTTAFRIDSHGFPVASWYLRLREDRSGGPLWGLVRVEIPLEVYTDAHASDVSRWVLAETAPLSMPDSRWDRLLYGISDCEAFLAAVTG